ncbi:hypothetical protein C1H46_002535 [Malus baccata]|uniref:C2H2-type domain-containing protein n=1 Tax=Malus baccata TaxID=106549 RepID=A0A540NLI6_MALBA|nr:hypothetical protein C1H46_002535 [Malus baccata]
MANCSEELDNAIAKLHQNFQELRYHLEKSFLEQGRALLKFEAQWKDLKKDLSRENEQRQVHLQQMIDMKDCEWYVYPLAVRFYTSPLFSQLYHRVVFPRSCCLVVFLVGLGYLRSKQQHEGFSIPSNGTEHYASANPNAASWSNSSARPAGNAVPRPSGNATPKLHCEVCNIYCDTKDVLNKHKQGKKHKMNLDKLKGKKIPGENSKKRAADQPPEDLETKKRKVLESGAAPDALRTCALCNVVCLSEMDFNNHRAGQRHVEAVAAARRHGAGTSATYSHWQSQWRYQGWNS